MSLIFELLADWFMKVLNSQFSPIFQSFPLLLGKFTSDSLQYVFIPMKKNAECISKSYNQTHGYSAKEIHSNVVCAGYMDEKTHPCQGDLGPSYEMKLDP